MKTSENSNKKIEHATITLWTNLNLLGDYRTLVFFFNQERVLGSQQSGNKPTRRSIGHFSSVGLVNREGANGVRPPGPPTPSTFQVTRF